APLGADPDSILMLYQERHLVRLRLDETTTERRFTDARRDEPREEFPDPRDQHQAKQQGRVEWEPRDGRGEQAEPLHSLRVRHGEGESDRTPQRVADEANALDGQGLQEFLQDFAEKPQCVMPIWFCRLTESGKVQSDEL